MSRRQRPRQARRDRRRRLRRPVGGARAGARAGAHHPGRPPQPPPVPAAAVPGRDRRACPRPTSPRRCATSCAGSATSTVLMGEVVGDRRRRARACALADGDALDYDYLLLASGATHAYFGHDDWAPHAPGLKTLDDALEIRRRMLPAFERAEAEADPARARGVADLRRRRRRPDRRRLAGTLAEIARHTLRDEFRHIDPAQRARAPARSRAARAVDVPRSRCRRKARAQLRAPRRRGAHRHAGRRDRCATACCSATNASPRAPCCGPPASPLAAGAHARRAARPRRPRAGRRPTSACRAIRRSSSPATSPACSRTASRCPASRRRPSRWAAHVAARSARGSPDKPAPAFRYRDFGNLATIGRSAAVVDLHGFRFSGCWRGGSGWSRTSSS